MPKKKESKISQPKKKKEGSVKKKSTLISRRKARLHKLLKDLESRSDKKIDCMKFRNSASIDFSSVEAVEEERWAEILEIKTLGTKSYYGCCHLDLCEERNWHKKDKYWIMCFTCEFEVLLKPFPTPEKCPTCPHKIVLGKEPGHMDWGCGCPQDGSLAKPLQREIERKIQSEINKAKV